MAEDINIKNKKASFEFSILQSYTAGMQLTGTEIKSIRTGKVNLTDGYCLVSNNEVFVKNIHIAEYEKGTHYNHAPKRDRKLLLQKQEIRKIVSKMKDKGIALIPLRLFINEKGLAKIEIALAKGKKAFDKRADIKEKDIRREMQRSED